MDLIPHYLLWGGEKSGVLADIYKKLSQAGIQVDEAFGIADVNEGCGVIQYLNKEDCNKALAVLNT